MRKQRQPGDIDPQIVENLIAAGENLGDIARRLGCDRTTLYHRNARNPELREAVKRGQARRREIELGRAMNSDTGEELEALLYQILNEVRGERVAA